MTVEQTQLFDDPFAPPAGPDPFERSHISYKCYCVAHGAKSPQEMQKIERDWRGPNRPNAGSWYQRQCRSARAAGFPGATGWPRSDDWLIEWVRNGRHLESQEGGDGV